MLIPFLRWATPINLSVMDTGLLGIMLGVVVIIITGIPLIIADRVIGGGNGTAASRLSSAAGAAVAANPVIIAQINPAFEPVAASATALVAASVIVTAILVPIITAPCQTLGNAQVVKAPGASVAPSANHYLFSPSCGGLCHSRICLEANVDVRQSIHSAHAKTLDTQGLRNEFLVERVFVADEYTMVRSHIDRIIVGGVMPVQRGCRWVAKSVNSLG